MKHGAGRPGSERAAATGEPRAADRAPSSRPKSPGVALPPSLARDHARESEADVLGRRAIADPAFVASVRIHDGPAGHDAAAARGARAYARGSDVYIGRGQRSDDRVAHELGHVVQQRRDGIERIDRDEPETDVALSWESAREVTYDAMETSVESDPPFWQRLRDDGTLGDQMLRIEPAVEKDTDAVKGAFESALVSLLQQPTADIILAGDDNYETVDLQVAADLLSEQLGSSKLADFGLPTSLGTAHFMAHMSDDIARVEVDLADTVRAAYHGFDESGTETLGDVLNTAADGVIPGHVERLSVLMQNAVETWGDPFGLLELELEASMIKITELRDAFKNAGSEGERQDIGMQLGFVARRMLVIDAHLQPLQTRLDQREDGVLVENVGDTLSALSSKAVVDTANTAAIDEVGALEERGAARSELGPQIVRITQPMAVPTGQPASTVIDSEEAYPEYTDKAVLAGQKALAEHLEKEAADLTSQKSTLVPTSITSFDQFEEVYRDWLTFWSRASRDSNQMFQMYTQLFEPITSILGMGGPSGWLGTMWMVDLMGGNVPVGEADASSLVREVERRAPLTTMDRTTGDVVGDDDEIGIAFKTATLAPGSGASMTFESEVTGRGGAVERASERSIESFRDVYAGPVADRATVAEEKDLYRGEDPGPTHFWDTADPGGVHGFTSKWSYFLATEVYSMTSFEPEVHFEHKLARKELAGYLFAYAQYAKGANRQHFLTDENGQKIGDAESRVGGLEAGKATAVARYLGGEADDTARNRTADGYRERITTAKASILAGHKPEKLVRDLEEVLDAYFKGGDALDRVRAILVIAMEQNDLKKAILEKFSMEAIGKAIAFVAGIAGVLWALSKLGTIGQVAAIALRKALKELGLKVDINAAIMAGQWATMSATCDNFTDAQRWGFVAKGAGAALAELLRDAAIGGAMKATGAAGEWAFARNAEVPRDVTPDALKDVFSPDGIGKQASWELELEVRKMLDGGQKLDKDAIAFLKQSTPEVYKRLKNDYPEAFKDKLRGTVEFAPGSAAAEMKAMVEAELPAELAAHVVIVSVKGSTSVKVRPVGGKLRVEVGEGRDPGAARTGVLHGHLGTLRRYAPFAGNLGRIRYLISKIGAYAGLDTAASRRGEAVAELEKLTEIHGKLSKLRDRTEKNLDRWTTAQKEPDQAALDAELKHIEDEIKLYESELDATGIGKGWVAIAGKNNFDEVEPLFGKPLDAAATAELQRLGYTVTDKGHVYRPDGAGETMVPVSRAKDGTLQLGTNETFSAGQARIRALLSAAQETKLQGLEAQALPPGTQMMLVKGMVDTNVKWFDILGGGANSAKRGELKKLLMTEGGLISKKADELIGGLLERDDTIKVVFGTKHIRESYPYRSKAGTADDEIAHHFDPLYMGGGHKLIANLPKIGPQNTDVHRAVHTFFDNLGLPASSTVLPPGTKLQPARLQSAGATAVGGTPTPAVAYVRDGEVTFDPL